MAPKSQKKKSAKASKVSPSSQPSPGRQRAHNDNDKRNKNGEIKTPLSSPQPSSLLPGIIVAVIAFLGGLVTPPSLHALRHQNLNANASAPEIRLPFPLPLPSQHFPCTSSNLDNYLHAVPVPGLHFVCVESMYLDADGNEKLFPKAQNFYEEQSRLNQVHSLRLTFYKGSHAAPLSRRVKVGGNGSEGVEFIKWSNVKEQLIVGLGLLPEGPTQQPWSVFSPLGEKITHEKHVIVNGDGIGSNKHIMSSITVSGIIVITQGGNWLWPGVREGFERSIELEPPTFSNTSSSGPRNITIETLSLKPLVLSIKGFLTDEECDYIAKKAEPSMKYSGVTLKDADKGKAASEWRTSQSTFLSAGDDTILKDIEHRTASLTRIPRSHQEYVQVLRYGESEKYDSHHDYFDPAAYQSDKSTLNLIEHGKKNRFATVFWYLTDVDDGGHTVFPRAGGRPPVRSHSDCSTGLKVQPQKGKVIIFYSLDASGNMDPLSLHGACPVGENNIKWAANKWIWNAPMGYITN